MALIKGNAGESTRQLSEKMYFKRVVYVIASICGVAFLIFLMFMPNFKNLGILGIVVVFVIVKIIMNRVDKKEKQFIKLEKRANIGAVAEEKIGQLLQQLPQDYAVFHDVVSPYGNIDHVILHKKNIVFLIETKSHSGEVTFDNNKLLVNGKIPEKDFIQQVLNNLFWLRNKIKEHLSVELYINPVLVFTKAFVKIPKPIKGVYVMNKKFLVNHLEEKVKKIHTQKDVNDTPTLFLFLGKLQSNNN